MDTIASSYGCRIPYKPSGANLAVFCSNCKSLRYLECERGYAPVAPCGFYFRDREPGRVEKDEQKAYIRTSPLFSETVYLKSVRYPAKISLVRVSGEEH